MSRYQKIMSLLAYISGIMAFIAILVDDKNSKLYSFHIWQAFFFNLIIGIIAMLVYSIWLPQYILTINISNRTMFLLYATVIPFAAILAISLVLGIMGARSIKFKLPLLGFFAETLTKFNNGENHGS